MAKTKLSPMMQYYLSLKEEYNDSILLFRLGDFYEMFFDDAKLASNILGLTLTGRNCGLEEKAPMCGVPFHAAEAYIAKLIKAGQKVAICEQLNTPEEAQGNLVERGVIRVITPGTIIEDNILEEKTNNYIASVYINNNEFSISYLDVSTGEFNTLLEKLSIDLIEDLLLTINPAEVIVNSETFDILKSLQSVKLNKIKNLTKYLDYAFDEYTAKNQLLKQFDTKTLDHFEIENKVACIKSAGALLGYVLDTQKRDLSHILGVKFIRNEESMILDSNTIKNLELLENIKDGSKKASILGVLDKTRTNMGGRYLRQWIEKPLKDSRLINRRLDSVEELMNSTYSRENLVELLKNVRDIERLCTKVSYGSPSPRDLLAIKYSLEQIPNIKHLIEPLNSDLIKEINENLNPLDDLRELLDKSIDENCSIVIRDGGFIKHGYNEELDGYLDVKKNGASLLAELEAKERELTGIKTLRVVYNKVFGYSIEVSKGQVSQVPLRYIRKQTLTTGERYITDELKNIEDKLLGSTDYAISLEIKLFNQIVNVVKNNIKTLQIIAKSIGSLDILLSFANVSMSNNYVKPVINEKIDEIKIVDGRHPVVEMIQHGNYVANDTLLDNTLNRTMIITGPNMGGKSTYMRQVALIVLMAHIGCFVPAKEAEISITDRIFTRIGASDDVAYGQSTFMVEMVEVATIINNATHKSLLILDEIGRGTSTCDGMAIARAVVEEVTTNIRCRTLFSTHYHELTELENVIQGVKNYKVTALERNDGIVFMHKIAHGGTDKSFGIEIAKLAGVNKQVIKRAREIKKNLNKLGISTQQKTEDSYDLLSISKDNTLKDELVNIDINQLSPMQAFNKLNDLIEIAKKG